MNALPKAKLTEVQEVELDRDIPEVPLFTGAIHSIDGIAQAITAMLKSAQDMRAAQAEQSEADLKAACEQIAEQAHGAHYLAKHLAKLVTQRQNRRPRA